MSAHGTTFRALKQNARYQISLQLLRETDDLVAQIGEKLDYSDLSNFSREFKGWSGMTPASYRKLLLNKRIESQSYNKSEK
ncbi:helix-turn-helix transcriptional regulator [Vibrio vulnificus]|uniref:helix-turn-helix domain-containing protein n=1 Tax=Vibrio vulnificus TaxID=672 RepID=UPI00102A72CA|nr:helix-turn-helix transcriptional regulator [Vibrio vulnificus]ELS0750844.1 helix-turn-helix transcriptional regulator [Vibrio vulnificus]MCA3908378.1 helix-turn-helix transcriptional regulator [Vibrio vulnificus]RZP85040.1 AraC family transcriptional regulator [Vibrio vulnificus]